MPWYFLNNIHGSCSMTPFHCGRFIPIPRLPPLNFAFRHQTRQNGLTRLCHFKGSTECGLLSPEFGGHNWRIIHCMPLECFKTVQTDSQNLKLASNCCCWSLAKRKFRLLFLLAAWAGLFMLLNRQFMKGKSYTFVFS